MPNIVESFMIGNTKVEICDDYCRDKSPQEVLDILDRIAKIAQPALTAQHFNHRMCEGENTV